MQSPPFSRYLVPPRSKYSTQQWLGQIYLSIDGAVLEVWISDVM